MGFTGASTPGGHYTSSFEYNAALARQIALTIIQRIENGWNDHNGGTSFLGGGHNPAGGSFDTHSGILGWTSSFSEDDAGSSLQGAAQDPSALIQRNVSLMGGEGQNTTVFAATGAASIQGLDKLSFHDNAGSAYFGNLAGGNTTLTGNATLPGSATLPGGASSGNFAALHGQFAGMMPFDFAGPNAAFLQQLGAGGLGGAGRNTVILSDHTQITFGGSQNLEEHSFMVPFAKGFLPKG